MTQTINWYPGHMKKTRELIEKNLTMVDFVIEMVDARIPSSGRNPIIEEILGDKPKILLLNKIDLAAEQSSEKWKTWFENRGIDVICCNAQKGLGMKFLLTALERQRQNRKGSRKQRPFRLMIVGIPNVGKSSLINRLVGKKATAVGNRPGVTRGKQWLKMANGMELLDTPGILWPKFEDPHVGLNLAFCGSIKEEVTDTSQLALDFIDFFQREYPEALSRRYQIETREEALQVLEAIGAKRGCLKKGNVIDYERTSGMILEEFRTGKIGRFTLENPPE